MRLWLTGCVLSLSLAWSSTLALAQNTQALKPVEKVQDQDPESVWKKLIGDWQPVEVVSPGGNKVPEDQLKGIKLTIQKDHYEVSANGFIDKGDIKLTLAAEGPNGMDLNGTEGPNKDKKILTIFKFDEDKMVVCYDIDAAERPKNFDEPAQGTNLLLITYKKMEPVK